MLTSRSLPRSSMLRLLLWMIVLAVSVRALVPSGYMPDRSARNASWLGLSLCLGSDRSLAVVLKGWDSGDAQGVADETAPDCMFGLMGQPAVDSIPAGSSVTEAAMSWQRMLPPIFQAMPVQPAMGPPLGQRAPPRFT